MAYAAPYNGWTVAELASMEPGRGPITTIRALTPGTYVRGRGVSRSPDAEDATDACVTTV
jgi:hypothetical protein